jgi:hypothetical protein
VFGQHLDFRLREPDTVGEIKPLIQHLLFGQSLLKAWGLLIPYRGPLKDRCTVRSR